MVIDASVAIKWFFPEEHSDLAFDLVARQQLRAPPLLMTEVGNAIWKKLRKRELTDPLDAFARHADLGQVIEIVEGRTGELAMRALELAIRLDHAIYDCVYLALAEADDDVLMTADGAFRRKVDATPLGRHVVSLA